MNSFKLKNRALAALLCLALVGGVVSTFFLKDTEEAAATETLSGIVALKNSNTEYNILEIVPDMSQSAFAWYFGDSEPVNSRKLTAAYGSDNATLVSKYQETVSVLQGQNYLLGTAVDQDYSENILQYLGTVSGDASELSGGFINNEWFHRYVLDWTEDESMAKIKMTTLSPENVTAAHISLADMVIISGGYYYPDYTVDPMTFSTDPSKNLKTEVADAIILGASRGMSVILDRRAYIPSEGSGLESNRVFLRLLGTDPRDTASGVYGSVFYYSSFASGDESANGVKLVDGSTLGVVGGLSQGYLVTPQFTTAFDSSMSTAGAPFAEVLKSIQDENSSRNSFQQTLLSEEITMAKVIRYLISGVASETTNPFRMKENVTILSIQPGDSSDIARYTASVHDGFGLNQPTVTPLVGLPVDYNQSIMSDQVSWELLESWTGVSRSNITVVEMSVKEFSLQSETVSSLYDMVYLGNDISALSYGIYGEASVFNTGGQQLAEDSAQTYFAVMGDENSKPGYSYVALENDISLTKYNELLDFVKAGRPVVIAPYLCAGLNYKTESTMPSNFSIDINSNLYSFLEKVAGQTCVMRQDALIVGTDGVAGNSDDNALWSTLLERVHIATPQVEFATLSAGSPQTYGENQSFQWTAADNELSYIFKISSLLDKSIYRLSLSLDMDGDGIYETSCNGYEDFSIEQLQTDTSGNLVLNGQQVVREREVDANELSQEQYYSVSVTLPDWIEGVVPWQIQVESLSDSSVTTMVEEITYVQPASQKTLAVLQVYGAGELSMEESSTYQELLGNVLGDTSAVQLLDDVNLVVYSITVDTFNQMIASGSSNLSGYHSNLVSYAVGMGYNASVYQNGSQSLFAILDKFDLLLLGSGDVSSALSYEAQSFVESYMSTGQNILFSDANMEVMDLPFYGGQYSASATRLSMGSTELNQLNTKQYQGYPYEIELTEEQFTLNEANVYYTNVPINNNVDDGKIIVNTLSSVMPMSILEDDGGTETGNIINFWATKDGIDGGTRLGNVFTYLVVGTTPSVNSIVVESSTRIYFSLPTISSAPEFCYFQLDGVGAALIDNFYNLDDEELNFADVIYAENMYDIYYIDIPEDIRERNGSNAMTLKAYTTVSVGDDSDPQFIAGNSVNIKVVYDTVSGDSLGMLEQNSSGDFVYLLPQG